MANNRPCCDGSQRAQVQPCSVSERSGQQNNLGFRVKQAAKQALQAKVGSSKFTVFNPNIIA